MPAEELVLIVLFISAFFGLTAALSRISKVVRIPYTVILLLSGLVAQVAGRWLQLPLEVGLSTDLIYYVLLPLLLFESAFHINLHQFHLQLRTITFLATFGVLAATGSIAALLAVLLGFPVGTALLFGALISATDPIAVLSVFKELGAPKRLALLADGESMFNDATAVILFRLIAGFVVTSQLVTFESIAGGLLNFIAIFLGSLVVGGAAGYITSEIISRIDNDRTVETTLTIGLALAVFIVSEHVLHVSGVISTVAAGIVMGNFGRTKISAPVLGFMEELWEYISFLAVSFIFFFASYDIELFAVLRDWKFLLVTILCVLVGRAIAVYGSFFISNKLHLFGLEPNVPTQWQHILFWGGLRGVIPLVLVYSLPDTYLHKSVLIELTLAVFLFTMLVNASTIEWLLKLLRLHVPKTEEQVIQLQQEIFNLDAARDHLASREAGEFNEGLVSEAESMITSKIERYQDRLSQLASPQEVETSLRLHALTLERKSALTLFKNEAISEAVLQEFSSELDMQQDALEYPELSGNRSLEAGGKIFSKERYTAQLQQLRRLIEKVPLLQHWLSNSKEDLIHRRLELLQARIVASSEVINYLENMSDLIEHQPAIADVIATVRSEHEQLRLKNNYQMQKIARTFPKAYTTFERDMLTAFALKQFNITFSHSRIHSF